MAQATKAQEPSTDDVLGRIRRIIGEDDAKPLQYQKKSATLGSDSVAPPPAQPAYSLPTPVPADQSAPSLPAVPEEPAGGAGSSSVMVDPSGAIASPTSQSADTGPDPSSKLAPASPLYAFDSDAEPRFGPTGEQATMPSRVEDSAPGGEKQGQLISRETNNAVSSAFDALAQTVLLHNARTLDDMVREMLRPILKVWLDDNLPTLVERLVRAEIERASQGPAPNK